MRCPKFRNYDVSPGTKHKRGVKSRVKKLSVTRDQNSIFFLEVDPIDAIRFIFYYTCIDIAAQ